VAVATKGVDEPSSRRKEKGPTWKCDHVAPNQRSRVTAKNRKVAAIVVDFEKKIKVSGMSKRWGTWYWDDGA